MLKDRHIVLGITGSIAAYKAAYLLRLLVKRGAEVQVVMTPAAREFVAPLTFSTLSQKPVITEFFTANSGVWNSHVDLGQWADLMLIAPATASTIGKMANGIADNMLVTTYLSMKAPVMLAPAMDLDMWAHPSTQRNLEALRKYGNTVIEPAEGELASSLTGKGRMEEPEKIVEAIEAFFTARQPLKGKKILITAGPTREPIDPVRYLSNYSTGKMGFAIAEQCAKQGAEVRLITGPVALSTPGGNIERIDVETAQQMYDSATALFPDCDAAILCAAVSDYRPASCAANKIKRSSETMSALELVANEDIARKLGEMKTGRQILIGFALETDNEIQNAKAKLKEKNLDGIVLNSLRNQGAGFGFDTNQVTLIDARSETSLPLLSKTETAKALIDYCLLSKGAENV